MDFLKSKSLRMFVVRVVGAVAVLLSNVVVIKYENNELAGLFFIVYTLFQLGVIFSRFGADIYIVREYYNFVDGKLERCFNRSIATSLVLGLVISAVLALIGYIYVRTWGAMSIDLEGSEVDLNLLWIFAALPFFSMATIVFFVYQARHKVVTQVLGVNVIQPWLFLVFYIVLKGCGEYYEWLNPSKTILLSFLCSIFLYVLISLVLTKNAGLSIQFLHYLLPSELSKSIRHQYKYATATLGTQLIGWIPYFLASYMLGPAFATVFNILQRLAMLSSFISISINSISAPHLAQLASRSDFVSIRNIFWSNTHKLILFSAGYVILLFAVVSFYPGFSNDLKLPAYVMLVGYFINCSTSVCGYYFQNASRIETLNLIQFIVALLAPVVTYLLSYAFGTLGAALSIAATVAGVNCILFPLAIKDLNIRTGRK